MQPPKTLIGLTIIIFGCVLAACGGGSPVTVEVTRTVPQTVEVTRVVEITRVVEVIVTATPTPMPEATPTPETEIALEVGSYTSFPTVLGGLYFAGEILNNGTAPATDVNFVLSLLDEQGNVLATTGSNIADLSVVPAGGKIPFLAMLDKNPEQYAKVEILVQGEEFTGSSIFPPYFDLKIDKVTGQKSTFGRYSLSGKVSNTGTKPAELVKIVALAYDENGKVIDVGWTFSKLDKILPGQESPFALDFTTIEKAPATYEVFTEGDEAT